MKPASEVGFSEFWAEYPRKVSKGHAEKAYDKAIKANLASHDEIMAGLRRFRDDLDKNPRETRLVCHASTWLNGKRWADEYAPPPSLGKELRKIGEQTAEDVYAQTTRELNQLVVDANSWWREHGCAVPLFWEYTHRCKHGEPTAEDLAKFELRKKAMAAPAPTPGFKTLGPRANRVPRPAGMPSMYENTAQLAPDENAPPPLEDMGEYGVERNY